MYRAMLLAVFVAILSSCQATPRVDYDTNYDFDSVKSYAWLEIAEDENELTEDRSGILDSDLTHGRLKSAIDRNLQAQGWQLVDAANADVLVAFHLRSSMQLERRKTIGYDGFTGWSYYGDPFYRRHRVTEVREKEYEVGTLLVDVLQNSEEPSLVWRGVQEGRLKDLGTPAERTKAINDTIDFMFSRFPPRDTEQ